jgi:protease PrsW
VVWAILPASAVVPSLLLMWYFNKRDLFREPPRVLWATFGLGVAVTVPVVLVAMPLTLLFAQLHNPHAKGLAEAFMMAAIPEELFKFLVVRFYCVRHREFDEPMDGIVYGAAASLGFASLENILYVTQGGLGVALMRAITAVPNHAFLGALMGYYLGQARFSPQTARQSTRLALLVPILLHGLYDYPLLASKAHVELYGSPSALLIALCTLVPAVLIFEWVWTVKLVRRLRRGQEALAASMAAPQPAAPAVVGSMTPQPAQPLAPAQPPRRRGASRFWGWFMVVVGAVLAIVGGLFTLGGAVGLATGADTSGTPLAQMLLGLTIIGVLPLLGGALLFGLGLRALNRDR